MYLTLIYLINEPALLTIFGILNQIFSTLLAYNYIQSHYIEIAQGAIFMKKKEIWADFGPVGNTG